MTIRALIIGLIGALFIATYGYMNDSIFRLTYLVGNHFPVSVFGFLVIITFGINPLLKKFRGSFALRPSELGLVVALWLAACGIPGSGQMRTFTTSLAVPMHFEQKKPGWRAREILDYAPDSFLAAEGEYKPEVMDRYMGTGSPEIIGLGDIPWGDWSDPIMTWGVLILCLSGGAFCVSLIVHRQWAYNERIRYPIAQIATAYIGNEKDPDGIPLSRSRLFWGAVIAVFCIHGINYFATWYPGSVEVPLKFNFGVILQEYPALRAAGGTTGNLFNPTFYLSVVAIAFILSSEASFSIGIAQVLYMLVIAFLVQMGMSVQSDWHGTTNISWQRFGSYVGLGLILLYTGRHFYGSVVKSAFTFKRDDATPAYAVWAFRLLLVALLVAVLFLQYYGLPWILGLLTMLGLLLLFTIMARLNAEMGLFFIQGNWLPVGILMSLFGCEALGPQYVAIIGMVCIVLAVDPRENIMPFIVNGLRIADNEKVKPAKTGPSMAGVYAVCLVAAMLFVMWASYQYGYPRRDGWANNSVPQMPFNLTNRCVQELAGKDMLAEAQNMTIWERLGSINPDSGFMTWVGIGIGLVLLFSFLRLRFTWWPLHPAIFAIWGSFPMTKFGSSFLLGWIIKASFTQFGTAHAYRKARHFMLGVIAGELGAALIFMAHGALYRIMTGLNPETFQIFPA